MSKQNNIYEGYIRYGVDSKSAEKYSSLNLPITTFKNTSQKNLIEKYGLSKEEIKRTKNCIKRKPVDEETLVKLLENCNFVCCCCKKIESGFIIHHIEEYSISQNNDYDNLVVLCPNHHDIAHRNSGLTYKLPPKVLKETKATWEEEVKKHNQQAATVKNEFPSTLNIKSIFNPKSKFNILLLNFERLENDQGKKIEETICRRLLQKIEEENLPIDIKYLTEIEIPRTFKEGRRIGKENKADLVIWGEVYDESKKGELMYSITSQAAPHLILDRRTGIQHIPSLVNIKEGYLQIDIDFIIYWALVASSFYLKNFDEVIKYSTKALKANSNYANCYFVLGQALYEKGEFQLAINSFSHSIELGANGADVYNNLGLCYVAQSLFIEAQKYLEKAFKITPFSDYILHNLGELHCRLGNHNLALSFLKRSIDINPNNSSIWSVIGNIYLEREEYENAFEAYEQGLTINENDSHVLNSIGMYYVKKDNLEEAKKYFKKSISFAKDPSRQLCSLGHIFIQEGKYNEAIDKFMDAIENSPIYITPYNYLIEIFYKSDNFPAVTNIYSYLNDLNDRLDFQTKKFVADSFYRIGEKDIALKILKDLYRINEEDIEILKGTTLTYLELGSIDKAEIYLKKYLNLNSTSLYSYFLRAKYWKIKGDLDKANQYYLDACKIEPKFKSDKWDDYFKS